MVFEGPCLSTKVERDSLFRNSLRWRRGWDSNPRYARTHNGFRDRPDRPLWHLSDLTNANGPAIWNRRAILPLMIEPVGAIIKEMAPESRMTGRCFWRAQTIRLSAACQAASHAAFSQAYRCWPKKPRTPPRRPALRPPGWSRVRTTRTGKSWEEGRFLSRHRHSAQSAPPDRKADRCPLSPTRPGPRGN